MQRKHVLFIVFALFMTALLHGAVSIRDVTVAQRWPWNGKVDIRYSVVCDETNADGTPREIYVSFSGYDNVLGRSIPMTQLTGDGVDGAVTAGGPYTATWDAAEAGENFHSASFVVRIRAASGDFDYMVVDLSGGASAKSFPVRYSLTPPDTADDACRTTQMWFRIFPAGSYVMGSPAGETGRTAEDMAQHRVILTKPVYIALFECTQRQWQQVMGTAPATYTGDTRPVEMVSFETIRGGSWPKGYHRVDAASFMGQLQKKTGLPFDLPTEAQWEFAGRKGADGVCVETALASGKNLENAVTCGNLAAIGRYAGNAGQGDTPEHAPAGSYPATGLGLYDIHGNVREWCLDWMGADTASTAEASDPAGPESGTKRVQRGGGWQDAAGACRLAARVAAMPAMRMPGTGFRAALTPGEGLTYALTYTLSPDTARWKVDGVERASGETVYLGAGEYLVTFCGCDGYASPESQTVNLQKDTELFAEYKCVHTLSFTLDIRSAQWTVDGKSYASGATAELSAGTYTVTFSDVAGYQNPGAQTVNLDKDLNISMSYKTPRFLVVDLSGGTKATSFPYRESVAPPDLSDPACRTTELWLRVIPAGTFVMGSPEDEIGRKNKYDFTQHQVTLSKKFYIGVFECTQAQWKLVMGKAPSEFSGETRPVETVSYEDIRGTFDEECGWPQDGNTVAASSFMGVVQKKTGLVFDLPTEAQWEYACRLRLDGTCYGTALNSGKNLSSTGHSDEMDEVGRYNYDTGDGKGGYAEHTVVGSYRASETGLYDMHGNVSEWCLDWYNSDTGSTAAVTDPAGPGNSTYRVYRGGCYGSYGGDFCRCAYRFREFPEEKFAGLGFRVVCLPAE